LQTTNHSLSISPPVYLSCHSCCLYLPFLQCPEIKTALGVLSAPKWVWAKSSHQMALCDWGCLWVHVYSLLDRYWQAIPPSIFTLCLKSMDDYLQVVDFSVAIETCSKLSHLVARNYMYLQLQTVNGNFKLPFLMSVVWNCNSYRAALAIQMSQVRLPASPLSGKLFTRVSATKSISLVLVKRHWCSTDGKTTTGLAMCHRLKWFIQLRA